MGRFKVPLEIHLPQGIGPGVFKALPGRGGLARLRTDAVVAVQDAGDCTGCDGNLLITHENMGDFASAPGGMGITHGEYLSLQGGIAAFGTVFGTVGLVFSRVACKPFAGGFAADAKAAAELAEVAGGLLGEGKEFLTLLVHGKGSPGHRVLRRWDGKSVTYVLAHLLPHVSGLYRRAGVVAGIQIPKNVCLCLVWKEVYFRTPPLIAVRSLRKP